MGNQSPDVPIPAPTQTREQIPSFPTIQKEIPSSPKIIDQPSPITIAPSEIQPETEKRGEQTPKTSNGSAEFTKPVQELLQSCGIDPTIVDAKPIGEGANHKVFLATPKEGDPFVIKIPKSKSPITMNAGNEDETAQIQKIQKAFPGYSLNTEIKIDPETKQYVVMQKAVLGKPITNKLTDPTLKAQLADIVALNRKLYKEYGESLDFVGMPGFISWIKRQFKKLITRHSEFEVSNLLVDEKTNRIYIIDTDVLRLHDGSLRTNLISRIGFFVNRLLMKHYFKLDIKHE